MRKVGSAMSQEVQKLLKIWEVAERLSCSESFVYNAIADGSLKHFRLGQGQGGIRISEEQLAAYLADRERGGTEDATVPLREITYRRSSPG